MQLLHLPGQLGEGMSHSSWTTSQPFLGGQLFGPQRTHSLHRNGKKNGKKPPQFSPLPHTEVPYCHAMELLFSPSRSLVGVSSHQNQQEEEEL